MARPLLIVGSLAYDDVETPSGKVTRALGGSAVYGAAAASLLSPVNIVGVVGNDFVVDDLGFLKERGVNLDGLEIAEGETFHWAGVYEDDLNVRHTLATDLNVFADFSPKIPEQYRDDDVVFLGNIDPGLQASVLDQLSAPKWVALDTMDFWITGALEPLKAVIERVHMVIINDSEARLLTGEANLIASAEKVLAMGPKAAVVKKGEHGVLLCTEEGYAVLPALPLGSVVDPTGAGDAFAGGMLGYLSATDDFSPDNLRRSLAFGTATASLTVEAFSVDALREVGERELAERYHALRKLAIIPEILT